LQVNEVLLVCTVAKTYYNTAGWHHWRRVWGDGKKFAIFELTFWGKIFIFRLKISDDLFLVIGSNFPVFCLFLLEI